jgi:hypothetical protein
MTRQGVASSLLACVAVWWALSAEAELLTNGSFENTNGVSTPFSFIQVTGTQVTGWTATSGTGGNFGWVLGPWFSAGPAYSGTNWINPQPTFGSISQSFPVTSGWNYTVSFFGRSRQNDANRGSVVAAITGVTLTGTSSVTTDINSVTWTQYSFGFTPTQSGTATLAFSSVGGWGGYADAASVVAVVPEPAAITVLATSLVGLFGYAWRKRR